MKYVITALIALCFTLTSTANARVSCKSFKTQKQAQAYYNKRKRAGKSGWKSLDRDKDGSACDCLPGGSGSKCPKRKRR